MKTNNYTIPYSYKLKYVNGKSKKDVEELGLNSYGQFDSDELPSSSMQIDANVSYDEAKERVEEEIRERYKGVLEIDDFWIGDSDVVEEERVRVRTDLPLEEIELKDVERSGRWDDSYSRLCDELATYEKGGQTKKYLVHPQNLVSSVYGINGFTKMIADEGITQGQLLEIASEVVEEWTYDWDEGQGFGSSDMTFMKKDFIDNVIYSIYGKNKQNSGRYKTIFNPTLSIIAYSKEGEIYAKGGELQGADISRLRKNIMGTLSLDLKVGSMRKSQDFIVYPMSELEDKIKIQSDKKFGIISLEDGRGILSKGSGNTFMHLRRDMAMRNVITFKLTPSQLEELKNEIRKTGGSKVGNSIVFSDNSGASLLAKGGKTTENVILKVNNQQVKVVHAENKRVLHKFESNSLDVKDLLSQLNKESKEYDLEPMYVLDVEFEADEKGGSTYNDGGDIKEGNVVKYNGYNYIVHSVDSSGKLNLHNPYQGYLMEYLVEPKEVTFVSALPFAKGGDIPKVETIVYSPMGEMSLDEYRDLSNEDMMGESKMDIDEVKAKVFIDNEEAYDYEDEIRKIDDVDELADFLYENGLAQADNTYNYSWWGGERQFYILNNNGSNFDLDYPTILFLSKHRDGDVRGNYEKFEAFRIIYGYEEIPFMSGSRLTFIVTDGDKKAVFSTDDMEGYELYVEESNFDDYDEGDSTNLDEVEEKLGISLY